MLVKIKYGRIDKKVGLTIKFYTDGEIILKQFDIAKIFFKEPKLLMLFQKSARTFLYAEREVERSFEKYSFKDKMIFSGPKKSFADNFKKNFFSILMTSILHECLDEDEKVRSYGKIIAYLRGVITATDNMIDNENKGNILLKEPKSLIVRNSLLLLMLQQELTLEIQSISPGKNAGEIFTKIFNIAQAESLREESQYAEYPTVDYILQEIHRGIGGELLDLSLEVPKSVEKNEKLKIYAQGLFEIGMSLQALDDICDIKEDIESEKVNYAVSYLIYNFNLKKEEVIKKIEFEEEVETLFTPLLDLCIERAVHGFSIMKSAGYPIGRTDTLKLLEMLFQIRGLDKCWKNSKYGKK
ncbi:MAG: hypothetical protein ACRCU6_04435 [Fusobacteriaceae bacterium]